VLGKAIEHEYNLADLLRRPDVDYATLMSLDGGPVRLAGTRDVSRETLGRTWRAPRDRAGRDRRQVRWLHRQAEGRESSAPPISKTWCFRPNWTTCQVPALSFEVRQKLSKHRPETLGQASRISGVTPAAISLLLVHLKKQRSKGFAASRRNDARQGGRVIGDDTGRLTLHEAS
jgi:tRNA uridine 5-carboxymethylaminomethyl modification enzyme